MTDEPGFVAFGGQADQVSAALKEQLLRGMSLTEAFGAALAALAAPGNGERTEIAAPSWRWPSWTAPATTARSAASARARLEELISESRAPPLHPRPRDAPDAAADGAASAAPAGPSPPARTPALPPGPARPVRIAAAAFRRGPPALTERPPLQRGSDDHEAVGAAAEAALDAAAAHSGIAAALTAGYWRGCLLAGGPRRSRALVPGASARAR